MKTYPLFQKTYYTDGDGLLLGVFKTKKRALKFVREKYPNYKRENNQEEFNNSINWFNDEESQLIELCLDYPEEIFIE
jgi:hypothetical protein